MHSVDMHYAVAKCPSISVTRRYSIETAKHILKLFSPSSSYIILSSHTKRHGNTSTGTHLTGASNASGYEKIAIFDQYLALFPK